MSSELATLKPPDVHQLLAKVQDKSLSFDARLSSVGAVMKATANKMMAALPKHVTPDRMMRVALNCIRKNPKLMDCSAASLFGAITEAATYGWELGGVLGHAYLVPFKDDCQLIPGYKGLIDLCRRSGQISTITMEVVHEGDEFRYSLGDDPHIHHKPDDRSKDRDSKPIIYVYAVVRLRDGGIQRSVWSAEKIDAHKKKYSKSWASAETSYNGRPAKKDSFWHTAWPAAAKKTVIRDMIARGLLPVSAEYRDAIDRGVKHDDDGDAFSSFDFVPQGSDEGLPAIEGEIEPDSGDRQQTTEEIDTALVAQATTDFAVATDEQGVDLVADVYYKRAESEATKKVIDGLVQSRKAAISAAEKAPRGKGAQKSLAGT